ncbi:DUF169 domain-containing protein [Flexistipes sp.]|uniref:DUF169 domain-containing protein n=1 Tax=Flexistipes sp. TaxID=3088135 RepID=UPI002E1C18A6|nr:DUF169 domain-containing protein [Flexistipes sp.]
MKCNMSEYLNLKTEPVATIWKDEAPEEKIQFQKGKRGCIISLMTAAAKGKTAVVDSETFGCPGGGVGLGFGNQYENFPGGTDCFARFLSNGNKGYPKGEAVAEQMKGKAPEHFIHEFLHGERYAKDPEIVEDFIDELGFMDIPAKYTIFKPLSKTEEDEKPVSITIFCNANQLSALIVLCNYFRKGINNVEAPFGAGCQSAGILTYQQLNTENPKGVIGLIDITARNAAKNSFGDNIMSFSMTYDLFKKMDTEVTESFLSTENWENLIN